MEQRGFDDALKVIRDRVVCLGRAKNWILQTTIPCGSRVIGYGRSDSDYDIIFVMKLSNRAYDLSRFFSQNPLEKQNQIESLKSQEDAGVASFRKGFLFQEDTIEWICNIKHGLVVSIYGFTFDLVFRFNHNTRDLDLLTEEFLDTDGFLFHQYLLFAVDKEYLEQGKLSLLRELASAGVNRKTKELIHWRDVRLFPFLDKKIKCASPKVKKSFSSFFFFMLAVLAGDRTMKESLKMFGWGFANYSDGAKEFVSNNGVRLELHFDHTCLRTYFGYMNMGTREELKPIIDAFYSKQGLVHQHFSWTNTETQIPRCVTNFVREFYETI